MSWRIASLYAVPLLVGCGFFSVKGSVSVGASNRGHLRHGQALPPKGDGYLIPVLWRTRGNRYATDELVHAIQHAARRVRREYPGGTLGIADLSAPRGGDSKLHRSHENGRDADLIYFATDLRSRPVLPADAMPRYGADLQSQPPNPTEGVKFGPFSPRRFDVVRNWALVRALLEEPGIEIQYLFCHHALKDQLLAQAHRIGEPEELMARADALLRQPSDSLPHDDHLHLRILCPADDRSYGCVDRGTIVPLKRRPLDRETELTGALAVLGLRPFFGLGHFVP